MRTRLLAVALLLGCRAASAAAQDGTEGAAKPLHVFQGQLSDKDVPDRMVKKSPHKVHEVRLQAGKSHALELHSKAFEAYLRLEDGQGKPLAHHDGGGKDAQLLFAPKESGTYRLIATAYPKDSRAGRTR